MKNALRLGGMAAILAMAGATAVVKNSEADPSGMRREYPLRYPQQAKDGEPDIQTPDDLKTLTLKNVDLQKKLDATRAQVEDLVKQLEITETACEDAMSEDGCPAGCKKEHLNEQSFEYGTGTGHF